MFLYYIPFIKEQLLIKENIFASDNMDKQLNEHIIKLCKTGKNDTNKLNKRNDETGKKFF